MAFFGKHPRRHSQRQGRLHPALLVLICTAAAILVTVIIGNILKATLDEETLRRLQQTETEEPNPPKYEAYLPEINAIPYVLAEDPNFPPETGAVSISLNEPLGLISYTSPITEFYGLNDTSEVPLAERLSPISASVPYISGVFYPQAFRESSADLFYAAATKDAALMQEFCRAGGSEILLVDLPISTESSERILTYLSIVKSAIPQNALGVAVRFDLATGGSAWELLPQLLEHADFFALDMQDTYIPEGASDLLDAADYYIKQYDMRLLLSTANTNLLRLAKLSQVTDRQIITPPPETEPEPIDPLPPEEETTPPSEEIQTENGAYG